MKATHRLKGNWNVKVFDVGDERDTYGKVTCKALTESGNAYLHTLLYPDALEPIPAPAPRRPFDYESWRALLKQHGGNVWVRDSPGGVSTFPFFGPLGIVGRAWIDAAKHLQYSTDFGDTWHEMSRE